MDDELMAEFVNESREHLATIEADLLAIEEGGADIDEQLVNKVFRAAHSIKGGSSFFGLTQVKDLSHKAETILDMLRARRMAPNAEITNVLLTAFDRLREMINDPAQRETTDVSDLLLALTGLASSYLPAEQKASLTAQLQFRPEGEDATCVLEQVDVDRVRRSGQHLYWAKLDLIHDVERKGVNILALFRDVAETGEILDCVIDFDAVGTLDGSIGVQLPLRLVFATVIQPSDVGHLIPIEQERIKSLIEVGPAAPVAVAPPAPLARPEPAPLPVIPIAAEPPPPAPLPAPPSFGDPSPSAGETVAAGRPAARVEAAAPSGGASAESTLRVHVGLLENLMNLAGELVLSRNQLRSAIVQNDRQSLQIADQRINQVTSDLQDAIMRTRLQPIGNVFGKFPRVVRDMANLLGKEITLEVHGKDVALDRSLIEGLSDPLTHMVRNAADHGIESPAERIHAGKPAMGVIRIEARHEAGQVVVEISDDGKGIDAQRVAEAALTKGLITPEKLRGLTESERMGLIFLPGLSTAKKVTDISGRGVGMDVVKSNIDRLGGLVEIKSEIGKGSVFRIKMPLTLAIIPSLIVSVGEERFAIPQVNVGELLCIRKQEAGKRIEVVGRAEVLVLRDRIIPLVRFDRLLESSAAAQNGESPGATAEGELRIVVVTTGSLHYGLAVDSFHDTEEIVVKPLGKHIKTQREYAGGTILGDGRVALILDVAGLAAKAELGVATEAIRTAEQAAEAERERLEDVHSMLLFHNAPDEVFATPLESVLRIQRVTPEQVETKGSRRTIQYRGGSLPLVTLADSAQVQPLGETRDLAVIVSSVRGREVGLLGAMPVDVVETNAVIDQSTHRQKGIAGSAIIHDRTTLITDIVELVDCVYPEWGAIAETLRAPIAEAGAPAAASSAVLLAEDSDFFRAQIKKYLEQDGFRVIEAPDGEAAWELLTANASTITAVVTDVEMPRLDGLGLARRIRADARFGRLPIIALTSLAGEDDIAKGKAAGIDDYQVKLDRDRLVTGLRTLANAA